MRLSDNPTVHYHLGMAEAAAGRSRPASWHLEAARDLGSARRKQDEAAEAEMAEIVRLAEEAMVKLPKAPSSRGARPE